MATWPVFTFVWMTLMNDATVDVQVSVWTYFFLFLLGIYLAVELMDHIVTLFTFSRCCQTGFQNSYINLHFSKKCAKVPVFLHPHRCLCSNFLIIVILLGVKWRLIVVWLDKHPGCLVIMSIFANACWPFGNVYSDSLPIFIWIIYLLIIEL